MAKLSRFAEGRLIKKQDKFTIPVSSVIPKLWTDTNSMKMHLLDITFRLTRSLAGYSPWDHKKSDTT